MKDKGKGKKVPQKVKGNIDDIMKKKVKPPVEMVDIREEYDLKEKVEFRDVDYNKDNQFIKRIKDFTFIKKEK